jgi:hypothetical protein
MRLSNIIQYTLHSSIHASLFNNIKKLFSFYNNRSSEVQRVRENRKDVGGNIGTRKKLQKDNLSKKRLHIHILNILIYYYYYYYYYIHFFGRFKPFYQRNLTNFLKNFSKAAYLFYVFCKAIFL